MCRIQFIAVFPLGVQMVIQASDSGNPEKRTVVEAFITVIRDQAPPIFLNLPYRAAVNELVTPGTRVLSVLATDVDLIVSNC